MRKIAFWVCLLSSFPSLSWAQESGGLDGPTKGIRYGSHVFWRKDIIAAAQKLLDLTEINTVVIDRKDDHGNEITGVTYRKLTQPFLDHGARIMCRIVVLKDNVFAQKKENRHLVLMSKSHPEKLWTDRKGNTYLDPEFKEVADHFVGVTIKAIEDGCTPNFDYIRLPAPRDGNTEDTKYPPAKTEEWIRNHAKNKGEAAAVRAENEKKNAEKRRVMQIFLERLVSGIRAKYPHAPLAASIFGYACYGQEPSVGQYLDDFVRLKIIISCMAYPSHYSCNDTAPNPSHNPYGIYQKTHREAQAYLKKFGLEAKFIPWLQGFDYATIEGCGLGKDEKGKTIGIRGKPSEVVKYANDPTYFRKQIQAGNDLGIFGWLVWPSEAAFKRTDLYLQKSRP